MNRISPRLLLAILALGASVSFADWAGTSPAHLVDFANARQQALGSTVFGDSANWNLYAMTGDPVGMLSGASQSWNVRTGYGYTRLSGEGQSLYHGLGGVDLRTSRQGFSALRLAWLPGQERLDAGDVTYSPTSQRFVLDMGFGGMGGFRGGFGTVVRLGSQSQSQMPGAKPDSAWTRTQVGLDALRLSLGGYAASLGLTITGRVNLAVAVDSLEWDALAKKRTRVGRTLLPQFGLAGSLDNPVWPVRVVADITHTVDQRLGAQNPAAVGGLGLSEHPVQEGTANRIFLAAQGRFAKPDVSHTWRPVVALDWQARTVAVYLPTDANNYPWQRGEKLENWGGKEGALESVLGLQYAWTQGLEATMEWARTGHEITRQEELVANGLSGDAKDAWTNHRISLGLELRHTLVPRWKNWFAQDAGLALRMGWLQQSMRGAALGADWFTNVHNSFALVASATGRAAPDYELLPEPGVSADARQIALGLGGWTAGHRYWGDAAVTFDEWKSAGATGKTLSGTGLVVQTGVRF